MKLCVCVITRSGSIQVSTLMRLMKIPIDVSIEWVDELDQTDKLKQLIPMYDRIVWVGYGMSGDVYSLLNPNLGQAIVPAAKRVDWEMFHTRTKAQSKEPASQRGLIFDTITEKSTNEVVSTQPRLWAINTRPLLKKIKKNPLPPYERFWSWMQHVAGQKIQVLGSMPVSMVFSHELKA